MAYLAHPKKSFVAYRKTPNDAWEIEDDPNRDPDRAYRRTRDRIDDLDTRVQTSAILLQVAYDLNRRYDTGNIVVAGFERFTENGHPFVRVRLENPSNDETSRWRTADSSSWRSTNCSRCKIGSTCGRARQKKHTEETPDMRFMKAYQF